ncbi:hypothetical protein CR513_41413, partial [Mucuna pruriens]
MPSASLENQIPHSILFPKDKITDSSRQWPSRSRQRLSRDDPNRENPAWSRLSADRHYRGGLSLSSD